MKHFHNHHLMQQDLIWVTFLTVRRYGLWVRRTVDASAAAANDDATTISVGLDTAA